MKKFFIPFFLLFTILNLSLDSFASDIQNEIIAKINSEDILKNKFDRLLNVQKKRLMEQLINETLILQEAKAKNITVSEEEITKKLNLIKEKQGGEKGFNRFLSENNATIEDAKNEIKNQILIQLTKKQINDLNVFLNEKKLQSNIIIYTNKIFPKESEEIVTLRKNAYPHPMSDEETNNILAHEIQEEETTDSNIRNKEYIVIEEQPQEQNTDIQENENKIFISDIKEDRIIEPLNITGNMERNNAQTENETLVPGTPLATSHQESVPQDQETLAPKDSSRILQELRRKLEQRRVTNR